MLDMLLPILIGFLAALSVLALIRLLRRRSAPTQTLTPPVPVSRQHRRALERQANKGR